jgi:hypothetical protein
MSEFNPVLSFIGPFIWHGNQPFHENQPKRLVFIPNIDHAETSVSACFERDNFGRLVFTVSIVAGSF